ncbi:MAG: spore coat associated protein CotJA [Lachnospira pectinoschiza]
MCYVPWQKWGDLYDPCKALKWNIISCIIQTFAGRQRRI